MVNAISNNSLSLNLQSAQAIGVATIATASQRLNRDAQQIANPDSQDQTDPLLDLSQSSFLAEAGAALIKTSNQMLGTLLNVFA